jgi:hypothetical protein
MSHDLFDERLAARLRRLDAGVPTGACVLASRAENRQVSSGRTRLDTRLPVGIAAAFLVVVVAVVIGLRGAGGGPASSAAVSPPVTATPAPTGMLVGPATGHLTDADRLVVALSITNATGRAEKLIGEESSAATDVGIYSFPACSAVPTPEGEPCPGPELMNWWVIDNGKTVYVYTLVMSGFLVAPQPGDEVPLTLLFESSSPVTVEVAVVP